MPFDNPRVDTLTLTDLAWRLRNPETWPDGFRWDYSECHSCAMGLAFALVHHKLPKVSPDYDVVAGIVRDLVPELKGAEEDEFDLIFRDISDKLDICTADVTPEHVADAIDDFLAEQGD